MIKKKWVSGNSVTSKLFIITVVFFVCFYGMVMLSQLLFFQDYYQHQKVSRVEANIRKFSRAYTAGEWSSARVSQEAAKFMRQNKNQLGIITMDGKIKFNDPFYITLKQADGRLMQIGLSLFMSQYSDELASSGIRIGDEIDIEGEWEQGFSKSIFDPVSIHKQGTASIGRTSSDEYSDDLVTIRGTVIQLVTPDLKTWSQRQGLLFIALEEWFPLSKRHTQQLREGKLIEEEWTEPWTGVRNVIIVQPVGTDDKHMELVFSVTSLQEVSEANDALRWFYLYLGLGGFCLILILSLFFSRLVTKPLISLNQTAKRMAGLDFSDHSTLKRNDEFGSLSHSMHTLSRTLDTTLGELTDANRQLVEDMEHKQRIERIQQDFFANASHELKTPLSIIKGFAEGLQDGISIGKQDHYIRVIIEESDKMEMLVKDMLDLVKLESGTVKLRKTTFMLSELVEEASDKLMHLLEDKQLQAVIILTNEAPVHADAARVEQVILNFMMNAIRYAEEASPITIRIESTEETTVISVENKGQPIPEDQLDQIWERFYRVEPSRSRQMGGTGLGLSIAKHILDLHECGYIVENTKEGVRFSVVFNK